MRGHDLVVPYGTEVMMREGLEATVSHTVTDADLATAIGSGEVPVLATPVVLALCEKATISVIADHLDAGQTTVGMRVSIDHLKPTLEGCDITASATLERIDGRRLTFGVSLLDHCTDEVALGRIVRVIVDSDRFMERAREAIES